MHLNGTRAAARWYLVPFGLALAIILVWALAAFVFVGAWDQLLGTILSAQRSLQQDLSGATRAAAEHGFTSAWTLIGLSFAYGVLHAAGPGHGKFVISTYLLSHESAVPRSLLLATLSALMQGVTAIVIIEILVALLGIGLRQATGLADNLEVTSYALVILIGVLLQGRVLIPPASDTRLSLKRRHKFHMAGPDELVDRGDALQLKAARHKRIGVLGEGRRVA